MASPWSPPVSAVPAPRPSASAGVRVGVPLAVFVLALAGYLAGTAPGLLWGDSAEMQILAAIGGVAHPTGYPLFTLVGRLFTLFGSGDLAFRANLLSASFAAGTLALLTAFLLGRNVRPAAACAAVAVWGLSFTFWSTAQRAEVYSLAAFVAVGAMWCTLLALEHGRRAMRLAAGFLLGLTLAGHMAFAPWVAVAGLTLAWRVPRTGWRWLADESALLGAFLVGLSPYGYLVWADQTGHGLSYLKLVELANFPVAPVPAAFHEPFERFKWLITSRNEYPPLPLRPSLRTIVQNVSDTSFLFALFELGPIAILAAWFGFRRRARAAHGEALLLLAMFAASVLFSIVISGSKILSVFLIPAYLVTAVWVAHGFQQLHDRLAVRMPHAAAVAWLALLPVSGALLAHSARLRSHEHPFGPLRSRVIEEDDRVERALLPNMSGEREARRFVESAVRMLPDSALVICDWREFMALQFLQRVEHRRLDLTLHPSGYPKLLEKVGQWQSGFDLARRPVVVVSSLGLMSRHLSSADTLRLATGQRVVVTRTPLRDLGH